MTVMPVTDIIERWRPGSARTDGWTWDDERAHLESIICECCGRPGHYQAGIITRLRLFGPTWSPVAAPVLGSDGRVWDGHHRICAALSIDPSMEFLVDVVDP